MQKRNRQNRSMAKHPSERNFKLKLDSSKERTNKGPMETQPLQFGSHVQGYEKKRRQEAAFILVVIMVFALLLSILSFIV